MTEKEKIIKVIDEWANKTVKANKFDGASVYNPHNAAGLADALIAAGLKFDVDYSFTTTFDHMQQARIDYLECRAAVAERQAMVLSKWLAEKTRKDYPWQAWFDAAQKQAEKELAEERKDD